MVFYEVLCELGDPSRRDAFVAWLRDEHVAEVCRAGALSGALLLPEDRPSVVRVLYRFATRDALARYERDEAPRLREAGLRAVERLGGDAVVLFERVRGELVEVEVA